MRSGFSNKKLNKNGFTLVELTVVFAVLAILSIMIVSFTALVKTNNITVTYNSNLVDNINDVELCLDSFIKSNDKSENEIQVSKDSIQVSKDSIQVSGKSLLASAISHNKDCIKDIVFSCGSPNSAPNSVIKMTITYYTTPNKVEEKSIIIIRYLYSAKVVANE